MQAEGGEGWLGHVRAVLSEVLRSDATEFEFAQGPLRLRVRRRLQPPDDPTERATEDSAPAEDKLVAVAAPLTGVFYACPSPGARNYVEIGEWAEAGTVVGLIEAMKVFNEVTAEQSGTVVRLAVEDGTLVHTGEALLYLDPADTPPLSLENVRE